MEDWVEIWLFGPGLTKKIDLHLLALVLWLLQTYQLSKNVKHPSPTSLRSQEVGVET